MREIMILSYFLASKLSARQQWIPVSGFGLSLAYWVRKPERVSRAGSLAVVPAPGFAALNIARNACEAMAERISDGDARLALRTRIARQVTIGKQRWRLALELHIEDNGPGVPESIRDRIFYPLVTGREGGSGLGLTLAQTFVQQHQGTIECDSEPGRTVFTVLIPLP